MADIITTLHPENNKKDNLYPNIKRENIPNKAINNSKLEDKSVSINKVDDAIKSLLEQSHQLTPSGVDISTNILAFTTNKGVWVATDNGHWYYWNGSKYADGGVYQATEVAKGSINYDKLDRDITDKFEDDFDGTTNLFDGLTLNGYFNEYGKLEPSNSWKVTKNYIKVENGKTYTLSALSEGSRTTSNFNFFCRYDENLNFIDETATPSFNSQYICDGTCAYIRFGFGSSLQDVVISTDDSTINKGYVISKNFINKKIGKFDMVEYFNENSDFVDLECEDVVYTITNNKMIGSNGFMDLSGMNITSYIPVNEDDLYCINASTIYGAYYYSFYDSDQKPFANLRTPIQEASYLVKKLIKVPKGASYLVVNGYSIAVKKVVGIKLSSNAKQDTLSILTDDRSKKLEQIAFTKVANKLITDGGIINYDDGSENWYVTDYIDVSNYDELYISGSSAYENTIYKFYDENKLPTQFLLRSNQGYTRTEISEYKISVPFGVKYLVVAGRNSEINILQVVGYKESKKWSNKKWVCVGDSLTEINSRTTKHYFDYVSEETGIQVVNMGVGGSGYKRLYNDNKAFYQRVSNIPLDADVITIFGSGNDLDGTPLGTPSDTGTSTLCGCINTTLDNILNRFLTNSKLPVIGVITPTPWVGSEPSDPDNGFSLYCNAIIECCRRKSIPVLDLYRKSNLHPDNATFRTLAYSKDEGGGVHPDENGHKIIAPMFKSLLEKLII